MCCLGRIQNSTSDPLRSLGRIHFQIRDLSNQLWTSIHRITDPSDPKVDLIGLMIQCVPLDKGSDINKWAQHFSHDGAFRRENMSQLSLACFCQGNSSGNGRNSSKVQKVEVACAKFPKNRVVLNRKIELVNGPHNIEISRLNKTAHCSSMSL